jgi:hypothetical protein
LPSQIALERLSLLVAQPRDFRQCFQIGTLQLGRRRDGGIKAFHGIHWLSPYLDQFLWNLHRFDGFSSYTPPFCKTFELPERDRELSDSENSKVEHLKNNMTGK